MSDEQELGVILAQNIQYYLDRDKLSRKELADRMGVSLSSVGFWCTGSKIPRADKLDMMCKIFGCERSDLLLKHPLHQKLDSATNNRLLQYSLKIAELSPDMRERVFSYIDFITQRKDHETPQ